MDNNRNVLDNERKRMGLFGKSLSDNFSSDKFTAKPKKAVDKASPSHFSSFFSKLADIKFHNVLVAALLIIAATNIVDSFFIKTVLIPSLKLRSKELRMLN